MANNYNPNFYLGVNEYPSINFKGTSLREESAWKTARAIYGNEIKIDVSNKKNGALKKFIEILDKNNDFHSFMFACERLIHIYGATLCLVYRDNDNYLWTVPTPFNSSYSYKYSNNLDSVKATCQIKYGNEDNQNIFVNFDYNRKTLEINGYSDEFDKNIPLSDNEKKAFNDFLKISGLQRRVKNYSGIVPAMLLTNYPVKSPFNTAFQQFYPEGQHVNYLQDLINNAIMTVDYELMANVTRVFLKLPKIQAEKLTSFLAGEENVPPELRKSFLKQKRIIQSKGVIISESSSGVIEGDNNWFNLQEGNPKLDIYMNFIERVRDFYLECIGLTSKTQSESLQTATEIKSLHRNEYQVINLKRGLRQKFLHNFICKTIDFHNGMAEKFGDEIINYQKDDFTVQINPPQEQDRQQKIDESIALIQNNLSTPELEIKELFNLTQDEAKKRWADILAYQKEQSEVMGGINTLNEEQTHQNNAITNQMEHDDKEDNGNDK